MVRTGCIAFMYITTYDQGYTLLVCILYRQQLVLNVNINMVINSLHTHLQS